MKTGKTQLAEVHVLDQLVAAMEPGHEDREDIRVSHGCTE